MVDSDDSRCYIPFGAGCVPSLFLSHTRKMLEQPFWHNCIDSACINEPALLVTSSLTRTLIIHGMLFASVLSHTLC